MLVGRDNAILLARQKDGSHKDKRLLQKRASNLIALANERPTNVNRYAEALLAAYVLACDRTGTDPAEWRHDGQGTSDCVVEARFASSPFRLTGKQSSPVREAKFRDPNELDLRDLPSVKSHGTSINSDARSAENTRGGGRFLTIVEHDALIPLYFRDALANTTLTPVSITSISFGCMIVRYKVASRDDLESLKNVDYPSVAETFSVKSLSLEGITVFRA